MVSAPDSGSKCPGSSHRRTGKILLVVGGGGGGELNVICPNETCWSQKQEDYSFVTSP